MAKIYLEHSGEFSVDTEASAKKAIGMLRERGYDAIISDFQMPGMNGIDFLKKHSINGEFLKERAQTGYQFPFLIKRLHEHKKRQNPGP